MEKEEIAQRIIKCRKRRNLTQAELAQRLFISDKAVSNWELGKNYPDIEMLSELDNQIGTNFINKNSKKKYIVIVLILILVLLIMIESFYLFAGETQYYLLECDEINLNNAYLYNYNGNVVINLNGMNLLDKQIKKYSIYVLYANNILLEKEYSANLTTTVDLSTSSTLLENLGSLYITLYFDSEPYEKTYKIYVKKISKKDKVLAQSIKANLLNENNYESDNGIFYYKRNDHENFYYDLEKEILYEETIFNDFNYKLQYSIKDRYIYIYTYDQQKPVSKMKYNIRNKKIICLSTECTDCFDIINSFLQEYYKIN